LPVRQALDRFSHVRVEPHRLAIWMRNDAGARTRVPEPAQMQLDRRHHLVVRLDSSSIPSPAAMRWGVSARANLSSALCRPNPGATAEMLLAGEGQQHFQLVDHARRRRRRGVFIA
jgi:hypothetical protein